MWPKGNISTVYILVIQELGHCTSILVIKIYHTLRFNCDIHLIAQIFGLCNKMEIRFENFRCSDFWVWGYTESRVIRCYSITQLLDLSYCSFKNGYYFSNITQPELYFSVFDTAFIHSSINISYTILLVTLSFLAPPMKNKPLCFWAIHSWVSDAMT